MPGLAAAAGLCGSTSSLESLVMGHQYLAASAAHGLHPQPGTVATMPSYGSSGNLSSYGDVMEPFAATKALLGAGYNPSTASLASLTGSNSPVPVQAAQFGLPNVDPTPTSRSACASPATPPVFAATAGAAAAQRPQPKADGLLLLLACADSGPVEQSVGA